jgi:hypothetical protein
LNLPNPNPPTAEGYAALRAAIDQHPGEKAHRRWVSIQTVHNCLIVNEAELREVVRMPETDEEYLHALLVNHDNQQDVFFTNLFRTLHNYLAMLVTLVDHSRAHMQFYSGTDFAKQQKKRNGEVRQRTSGKLLRDLRKYMLHRTVPPMEFTARFTRDAPNGEHFAVQLNAASLLEWSNWSADSKRYLKSVEALNVGDVIDDYAEAVTTYYGWFYDQFQVLHTQDIEDRNRLVLRYQSFWEAEPS